LLSGKYSQWETGFSLWTGGKSTDKSKAFCQVIIWAKRFFYRRFYLFPMQYILALCGGNSTVNGVSESRKPTSSPE
jgi:hypothetical protein